MSPVTEQLARYVSELSFDDLPPDVIERSKLLLLDLVASTLGGRFKAETTHHLLETATSLEWRNGTATVLGASADFTPSAAALINGAMAHSLEFDDTHAAASLHPSATVVPAALAAAEMVDANGRELLTAIVAGYELGCRVSKALVPAEHYQRGFHPTATVGVFAAAAAAGRVFGLSPQGIVSALGLAGSQSAGSMQFMDNGAWNKRFHVGAAAQNGLIAATLARHGYLGASAAIEGRSGFLNAYAPAPDAELAAADLGVRYETLSIALKPYPACRLIHAAIDALLELRVAHDLSFEQVENVEIGLSQMALDITGHPQDLKRKPRNIVESQFSAHAAAAIALRQGSLTWADFEDFWQDPGILDFAERIAVYQDHDVQADYPERLSGRVRIAANGASYERKVDIPSGEPERFMTTDAVGEKFRGLVADVMNENRMAAVSDRALHVDELTTVRELTTSTLVDPPTQLATAAAG